MSSIDNIAPSNTLTGLRPNGRQVRSLKEVELWYIRYALYYHQGNLRRVAEDLEISRTTLYKRMMENRIDASSPFGTRDNPQGTQVPFVPDAHSSPPAPEHAPAPPMPDNVRFIGTKWYVVNEAEGWIQEVNPETWEPVITDEDDDDYDDYPGPDSGTSMP